MAREVENGMLDYSEYGSGYCGTCGGFSNTRYDEDIDVDDDDDN